MVILARERPGPGLEYAGWLATAVHDRGLMDQKQIQVVDHQDGLKALLGLQAMALFEWFLTCKGARWVSGQVVRTIHADGVELCKRYTDREPLATRKVSRIPKLNPLYLTKNSSERRKKGVSRGTSR